MTNPMPETVAPLPCPLCNHLPGWAGCAGDLVTLGCCEHFESWPDFHLSSMAWNKYVERQKEKTP